MPSDETGPDEPELFPPHDPTPPSDASVPNASLSEENEWLQEFLNAEPRIGESLYDHFSYDLLDELSTDGSPELLDGGLMDDLILETLMAGDRYDQLLGE